MATVRGIAQRRVGRLAQPGRGRGHRVAGGDRELRQRQEAVVGADQRDVGAVQRGDDLGGASRRVGGQHLAGQVGAGGVRDGVVGVDQIELLAAGDLDQLRRQRQRVGRVLELRVGAHLDGVEQDVRLALVEASRDVVAEDVDAVAAPGQPHRDLGRDDAAAAEGREAGDADVEEVGRHGPLRLGL